MAELNKIRFLLFVSLMTFPVHGLDVILSNARSDFKQKYEINSNVINVINGQKMYVGTLNPLIYQAQPSTSKVIVHISSKSRFVEIIRNAVCEVRVQIARQLFRCHCELVFLGIEDFDDDEYGLISAFIANKIQRHWNQTNFIIETVGVNRFDYPYQYNAQSFPKYQENAHICGGTLSALLKSIPHGVLTPAGSNYKKIKLYDYGYLVKEVSWPVNLEDGLYVPNLNVTHPKYNFRIRYPNMKINLVILGGKEYKAATSIEIDSPEMIQISAILNEMTNNNEVLIILGAFNFDWTEVEIVTQIILQHSYGWHESYYDVFIHGFGIFDTMFPYVYKNNRRFLPQHPNPSVSQIMNIMIGEEVKQRSINLYYLDIDWEESKIPIYLSNGRYFAGERSHNFSFPKPNQKTVFIVYDPAEMNGQTDFVMVCQYVTKLKESGIYVVMTGAINFGLNDVHIIAEWIDWLRGDIDPEQISVLGAGSFDTIFQSELATYNTFLYKKNELRVIQNAYVNNINTKNVIVAKTNSPADFWLYPINTLNGFYEPELISNRNMFDTEGGKMLFFVIISVSTFVQISTVHNQTKTTSSFKEKMEKNYPASEWSVYFVGLDNFGDRDSHLFGELVEAHTHDPRPLDGYVLTFHHGLNQTIYHYKDMPLPVESGKRKHSLITCYIMWACEH